MRLPAPFIKLPFRFDAERLQIELDTIEDSAWMDHPSGLPGNSAVALVSHNGGNNDEFGGKMMETPHLTALPYHRQVMASFGEVLSRSRLMRLAGGSQVSPHVDFNYHWYNRLRIHVPIVTNPKVVFHCGDETIHMLAGECWLFDSWRWHKVVNDSDQVRTHLVIDISGSSRFWELVEKAENGSCEDEEIDYVDGAKVTIRLENFNVAPVMAPGEFEAIAREIIQDFEGHANNPPDLVEKYRSLLLNLGRDWREIWYEHGQGPSGWPKYEELLQKTQRQLHPERRALVTASNNVGVNPIIVQRLLRAALATDYYDEFMAGINRQK